MYNRLRKVFFICVLPVCVLLLSAGMAVGGEGIIFTDKSVDFYGYGDGLKPGDVITAHDPDGVLCGKFVVQKDGQYGIIHVYGDDITSVDVDEGAVEGDIITFYINGTEAVVADIDRMVWTRDGDSVKVDLLR